MINKKPPGLWHERSSGQFTTTMHCIFFSLYHPLQESQGSNGMAERAQGFAQSLAHDWLDQRRVKKAPQCLLTHWRMCRPPMIWPRPRVARTREKVASRRRRLAAHCQRPQELPASKLVLWEPAHPHTNRRGRTEEKFSSRKHWRSSQVHGGSRRLETPLEESSQDGLERWASGLMSGNYLAEKTTCLGRFSRHFWNPHVTTNKEVQTIATRIKCNRCI